MSDKVVNIRDAVKGAKPAPRAKKKPDSAGDRPPEAPPPGDGFYGPPKRLPPGAPVQALGRLQRNYYFLDAAGQFLCLQDKDIGRNAIIGLFGGNEYLIATWPAYNKDGDPIPEFKHGLLSPVLISSCHDKGLWDPEENVRGVGTWAEDDGTLVMHCGDKLHLSTGFVLPTGLRGRLLYPAAPPLPHPESGRPGDSCAGVLFDKLKSWNWMRGGSESDVDAKMLIGWIIHAFLGAAPEWRPVVWITGGSGTGKSTLMKLVRWIFGERAMVRSEDASAAGVKHRVRDTSLPVSIDELESEEDNRKADDIVKLARIAASGGESLRGTPGGGSLTFVARNCFVFSSIIIPSLRQQDKNRMAILSLDRVEWEGARTRREPGEDDAADDDEDSVLGAKAEWERLGRQLRGRVLGQWHRYLKTWRVYRRALERAGHTARGADQFGALGAGYDLAMYDALNEERAEEWARQLPANRLAETTGYEVNERACLKQLLGAQVDAWKGGVKESVSRLLRGARNELADRALNDRPQEAALQQIGIRVFRDRRDPAIWRIAISHTHPALARIFGGTDWKGRPGAPGAWAQALDRLPQVERSSKGGSPRLRIDGDLHYCTVLFWDVVFPPMDSAGADLDFAEMVSEDDTSAGERQPLI